MLTMTITCYEEVVMTLMGVSSLEEDVLAAEVLMVFMEGTLETWAVDPNITDEAAVAEVKRYYPESFGWDMEKFPFEPKFYLRRKP